MRPRAQVVTRGLFLMVISSQDMMRVAGNGDKQLMICWSSQGLNCLSLPTNLSCRRDLSSTEAKPHQAGEAYLPAKRRLLLLQHGVTVVVSGRELSTSVGQIWMRRMLKEISWSTAVSSSSLF